MAETRGEWRVSAFDDLTAREVHDLLRLRVDVFVVEQACAYAEIDGKDPSAFHLRRLVGDELAGCLRILPPAATGANARIGRVVTAPAHRGTGLGHGMIEQAVAFIEDRFPGHGIDITAQAHLDRFYGRHGFAAVSDVFDQDGIPHLDLTRPA